tara:strand:+ start:144 stop:965 length:822 start_codon:yes stop_codon:yes gene_type:complete
MSFKEDIENYLIKTFKIKYYRGSQFHPNLIVESLKSLFGLNPQKGNKIILDYLPKYLNKFEENNESDISVENVEYFASMINLEILLKENNFDESRNEIKRLLQVSTGEPILELFIIIYLKNITLLPNLFSVYRSVKFCNGRNVDEAIFLMLNFAEKNHKTTNNLSKIFFLNYSTSILEISQNIFIRDLEIKNILQEIDYKMVNNQISANKKSDFGEELILNGRNQILDYINKNPKIIKNDKNILLLNSLRTFLRYRKSDEYDRQLHFAVNELE